MAKCQTAIDKGDCFCGCDTTPGFKWDCGKEPHGCETDYQKNEQVGKEVRQILSIATLCEKHQHYYHDHRDAENLLIYRKKIDATDYIHVPKSVLKELYDCSNCGQEIKKLTLKQHEWPYDKKEDIQ